MSTVKEKLETIKKMLFNEEATVETKFAEAVLADGTTISYDGALEVGTAVFIVSEEGEQVPMTAGTYELGGEMEGTTIIVDEAGVITEVVEAGTEEPAAEEMSSEKVEQIVEEKMSAFASSLETIAKGLSAYKAENKAVKQENEKLSKELESLKTEFAKFKDTPSTKEEVKVKFNREDNLTSYQRQLLNKRKNK